MIDKVPMTAG